MRPTRPRILIAAPSAVIGRLERAFTDDVEVVGAETWDEAVEQLRDAEPDLVIVCYVFDDMRPFRLLHHMRHDKRRHVPTILVRAVPVSLGRTQEAEIRESYRTLGVDEFINLHDESQEDGPAAALQRFRESVLSRLSIVTARE